MTGESDLLEFKAATGTRRQAAATVCAILNQRGRHMLFGIAPVIRVVGERVSAGSQRFEPPAFPEIEPVRVSGDPEVIVVRASPGESPPYRYQGTSGLHVCGTTLAMFAEEYNRMLFERMHNERRWEKGIFITSSRSLVLDVRGARFLHRTF